MKIRNIFATLGMIGTCMIYAGCHVPQVAQKQENKEVPETYSVDQDTLNTGLVKWRDFFTDPNLAVLIDTALKNNQELNITLQEIEIARNEVRAKKGELLPSVGYRAGVGIDKAGRYTSQGAGDASTEITPGKKVPDYLGDFIVGINANWEVDIWNKLHNAKDAEVDRYLSTIEGKNFVLSNLIAEVANSYYELLSLDYQLDIVKQNIALQKNALEIVKVQKQAARATELAVQKFEAEVKSTQSREFEIRQGIKETENRINFLLARYPQPIARKETGFMDLPLAPVSTGVPSQLLANRPDIRQAELELAASKLDVKVARAQFYPSFDISAMIGFNAFNPSYLVKFPESLITSLVGDLAGPLINKNAIKAQYLTANARQLQAVYNYERSILSGYIEVANQLSNISNLQQTFEQKQEQVKVLNKSVDVSNALYKAARADYLEVLTTQRDVLEARLELAETKKNQLGAVVNIYKDLGGGWR
ncbi:TolC family protein [Niabella sp. CJ426]|jgi:multidrug efflux system outer membrane protein|uniref:TolC family protein n=1 Tax=Niabella sp. CJ426 TaxID=3393740 RepID=UPI003D01F482